METRMLRRSKSWIPGGESQERLATIMMLFKSARI